MTLLTTIGAVAQNPEGWNDGNLPLTLYKIDSKQNGWLQKGDSIYSAFEIEKQLYASGVKWSKNAIAFGMAFHNDKSVPVKNGFEVGEKIYWGVCRNGKIWELELQNTFEKNGDVYAIFQLGERPLIILDNPYYSLDPVWPEITELRINEPTTTKALKFYQFMPGFSALTPKWTTGSFFPEISETNAVLRFSKGRNGIIFLNACEIRFRKADVEKGYFMLKIHATPLKNSQSKQFFKTYKIYWK